MGWLCRELVVALQARHLRYQQAASAGGHACGSNRIPARAGDRGSPDPEQHVFGAVPPISA